MQVDSYAYLPPNLDHTVETDAAATLVVFERRLVFYFMVPHVRIIMYTVIDLWYHNSMHSFSNIPLWLPGSRFLVYLNFKCSKSFVLGILDWKVMLLN